MLAGLCRCRRRIATSLPQPAAHLALATALGTEKQQSIRLENSEAFAVKKFNFGLFHYETEVKKKTATII